MFPSAHILSENGGLVTFEIPRSEMKMGLAFSQLEANKERLDIEDYSIAQPTLEQVFIRTVNKYDPPEQSSAPENTGGHRDEVVLDRNKCGCTNLTVKIMSAVSCVLAIAFIAIAIGVFAQSDQKAFVAFFLVGIVGIITSIVGCIILCCACCQPPRGVDE